MLLSYNAGDVSMFGNAYVKVAYNHGGNDGMNILKLCLRFVAALVVPMIVAMLIIKLAENIPDPIGIITTADGKGVLALMFSGAAAGWAFSALTYQIAPKGKLVFSAVTSVLMILWLVIGIVVMAQNYAYHADWWVWARLGLFPVGLIGGWISAYNSSRKEPRDD